jgi:hypothetical protein
MDSSSAAVAIGYQPSQPETVAVLHVPADGKAAAIQVASVVRCVLKCAVVCRGCGRVAGGVAGILTPRDRPVLLEPSKYGSFVTLGGLA